MGELEVERVSWRYGYVRVMGTVRRDGVATTVLSSIYRISCVMIDDSHVSVGKDKVLTTVLNLWIGTPGPVAVRPGAY